ncbi:hypothetical protein LTR10_011715 [Elasticomyces elasticus]|uniref:NADPH--hemoprotein reductase n=1 Tax=Exophiala sideris TaxID=1016849 RepID=A0ABR0JE14_9EURO|nr:hypothetical protein LTR10_011715 [Elasticomyces elasticus]KAK5061910.1 hypothetical protein LTR69_005094 [Exophiala sideris]KAK5184610.1 hypothetical protein LTR44_003285 [Eurotiomycetes sp. CCFEE 6388]
MEIPYHGSVSHLAIQTVLRSFKAMSIGDWLVIFAILFAFCFYLGDGKLWGKPDPNSRLWYEAPQKMGAFGVKQQQSRNFGSRLVESSSDIAILWGSQSGVSEAFAERLARHWQSRFGLRILVADLDEYDASSLSGVPVGKVCVFLCSTYGEGDPPDNAVNFCTSLESMRKRGTRLDDLQYLALGMGNKNYKHYNQVIVDIDRALIELGGSRIGPLGKADESQGRTEEGFIEWKEAVLEDLGKIIQLHEQPITYQPILDVLDVCVDEQSLWKGEPSEDNLLNVTDGVVHSAKNPYAASIAVANTLSPNLDRVCVHMEVSIANAPTLRYQAGDHLAVRPVNPTDEVDRLLRLLGMDSPEQRKQPIILDVRNGATSRSNLPSPTTREALLMYYLEICALAPRDLLLFLSLYAPTDAAKASLVTLATNNSAYRREVADTYASTGRVMEMVERDQPWSKVPFSLLVESFNHIQPRYYSISSSPLVQPRQPAITLAVNSRHVSWQQNGKDVDRFYGLATNFLLAHERQSTVKETHKQMTSGLQSQSYSFVPRYDLEGPRSKLSGGKVYVHIRKSTFKLPMNPAIPIIMVAAGTGIAPFRGFIQERTRLTELGKSIGNMLLLFGCRDDGDDFLYKDEWAEKQVKLGDKFRLIPCFSRMVSQKKMYVQDGLAEHKELVANMIEDGAAFYVCGSAAMAREVRTRLNHVLAEHREQSLEDADTWVSGRMKRAGLYHEDVWG